MIVNLNVEGNVFKWEILSGAILNTANSIRTNPFSFTLNQVKWDPIEFVHSLNVYQLALYSFLG